METQGEYQLIIRVPFKAMDHPQARQVVQNILSTMHLPKEAIVKVQELKKNEPPVGVVYTLQN